MTAGQEFVKMLKPAGCVIFLLVLIGFFAMCFSPSPAPIKGYSVPHDSDYFAEHPDELKAELEEHVFPELEGIADCTVSDGVLVITIDSASFDESSSAISYYYREALFDFQKK